MPSQYQLAASGRNESVATQGGTTTSHWVVDPPARFASFEVGLFRRIDIQADSLPPVRVMLVDTHRAGQVETLSATDASPRTQEQRVAAEVANEAKFYRRAFGAPPDIALHAVQGTEEDAARSPQLVRLPMMFTRDRDPAVPTMFYRAREVARQWWGESARPATSRDEWLCEGLANFSAAWFAQNSGPGTQGYLALLESWRQQVLENRDQLAGRSTPAGPLCVGARLDEAPGGGARASDDDAHRLERRAAWVIHMLRGLMLDEQDPGELRFAGMMRDFYTAHRGGAFTTLEFRAAAERALDRDLGWFFDQWVDHAPIPTYTFSYHVDRAADGRYVVRGRVAQSRVPADFRMDVPIRVEAGSGAPTRLRVHVQGALTEFELPAVSEKPVRVVFNDLGAVLCEVVETAWK